MRRARVVETGIEPGSLGAVRVCLAALASWSALKLDVRRKMAWWWRRFVGAQRGRKWSGMGLPGGARRSGEVEGIDEEGAEAVVRRLSFTGEDVAVANSGGGRSAAQKPTRKHHGDAQDQHEGEGLS